MGRPRSTPNTGALLNTILRRLAVVERRSRDVLAPVALASAHTNSSGSYVNAHAALVNPVGATITWWVEVNVTGGSAQIQLVDDEGNAGPATTTASDGLYRVNLPVPDGWDVGEDRVVFLRTRVTTASSVQVLPLRALVA